MWLKVDDTKMKGPMDLFTTKKSNRGVQLKQKSIVNACDKEMRGRTIQYIARFFYQAGIAFNVVKLDSFADMVEAIGRYGSHLKPPSYHEMRVPLLEKEVSYTNELMKNHKEEWAKHGCSIMSDGWTDRKQRTLINFMVNCSLGTMFVESVDDSSYMKTGERVFELLDKFVTRIGEENIVQVITDNGSNFKLAGELLMAKRKQLYWTPCAAHCIDLMLDDIGKIEKVKKTLVRAIALVGYIYNHTSTLDMMREFTGGRELMRHGITRFATSFLTLMSVYKQKQNLRKMFTSEKLTSNKLAKEAKGKKACETVLLPSFWNNVVFTLKVMGPLVRVLRLVDNEKRPAMGYIYEAMDRAKEAIAKAFSGDEKKYKAIYDIIDERWQCQLHQPLHAAGHYLNPQFFYSDSSIQNDEEITDGLFKCIERLVLSMDVKLKIDEELSKYRNADGQFGIPMAIRTRNTKSPAEWWRSYGNSTPNLKSLAIKILSLTYSASGCERNWSMFEQIHSKKKNRLEHQRLQDLIFVKYNQTLKARYNRKDTIDPISLNDIDDCNEWLIGEMGDFSHAEEEYVFGDDTLNWGLVGEASGVGETRKTRQHRSSKSKGKSKISTSQESRPLRRVEEKAKSKGKSKVSTTQESQPLKMIDEDEEFEFEEDLDEDEITDLALNFNDDGDDDIVEFDDGDEFDDEDVVDDED